MWAAEAGNAAIVKRLITAGSDVRVRDDDGKTAADVTINDEVKKILLEAGAEQKKAFRFNPPGPIADVKIIIRNQNGALLPYDGGLPLILSIHGSFGAQTPDLVAFDVVRSRL